MVGASWLAHLALGDAALNVGRSAKAELARADEIHSSCTVEQTENETQLKGNAGKPVQ